MAVPWLSDLPWSNQLAVYTPHAQITLNRPHESYSTGLLLISHTENSTYGTSSTVSSPCLSFKPWPYLLFHVYAKHLVTSNRLIPQLLNFWLLLANVDLLFPLGFSRIDLIEVFKMLAGLKRHRDFEDDEGLECSDYKVCTQLLCYNSGG